jgi:uncharacterized membrane protein
LLQAQKSLNYKAIGFVIVVVISISCFVFDFFSVIVIGVEGFSFLFGWCELLLQTQTSLTY